MSLLRRLAYIQLGQSDSPAALADLLAQARAAVRSPTTTTSNNHAEPTDEPSTALVEHESERSVDELVRAGLAHRVAAVQRAAAAELERRLRGGTAGESASLAEKLRQIDAFRPAVALLRAPESEVLTMLAVVKFLLAAANVDAATRERLRYVGALPALLARCGAAAAAANFSPALFPTSAPAAGATVDESSEKLTLACLRCLLALVVEPAARSALRRVDGLARLVRLVSADDAKSPLQLVATAVMALVTVDAGAADELTPDAVADVVVMLLQRAADERIVAQALRLLLNASRAASLCARIASADDGRTRRALVHMFEKFLSADELYAATAAAASGTALTRALAQHKEQQTTLLAALAGFARNEALCRALLPVVPRVAQFLRAPAGSGESFAWDATVLAAALGAVQMLCVSDSSRAALLEDGVTRAALCAIVDTPRLYAPSVAAAAASCLQALWQMQADQKLDPKEARGVVSLLRRSDRHPDAARAAVQTLTAIAGGGEAVLVPLLALGGLELLHGIVADTIAVGDADSALAALDIRIEAARALRRLARIASARVALVALAPVGSLATLPLDVDGNAEAARFAAVVLQLLAQLVRDASSARALLDEPAALGALIARVTCKHAQLRRAALAALAALARHSLAEMTRWGVIDHLLEFVALDDAAGASAPERQVAMQLLTAVAATPDGEALLAAAERLHRLRVLTTSPKSQASIVGKMARNILSAVSLRTTLAAAQAAPLGGATAVRTVPYLRCEASDGRVAALDAPAASDGATKRWLDGELATLFQLSAAVPATFLPDHGAARVLASDADVRGCVQAAAAAPSRSVRVLVQTAPFDSGIDRDTVKRILDKLSREDLIQLLDATSQLGRVLIKDALVAWRSNGAKAPAPAASAAPPTPTKAVPPPPPPGEGASVSARRAPPPPPPPAPAAAAAVESEPAVVDAAAAELVAAFDAAAVRFQEMAMAMALEEAHAAGEAMLEAAALPSDDATTMELETLQNELADATNYVLECAQVVLEDPDDEDAVERFTASLHGVQAAIVSVRQVLAPWEYADDDEQRTDTAFPGQFRVTAADIRKVKLRDQSLRMTDDAAAVAADDGDTANMKLLAELRVAVKGGVQLRKVERLTAAERESSRQLSASEVMLRDLTANVQARRTAGLERRVLLDQDTQLGYRYYSDVPRWLEALAPLLCDAARGQALLRLLLTLCEMRDSELPWAEAALSFGGDETWLANALRVVGFSLKRRIYARRFADASDDNRVVEYEAVVRPTSLPLSTLARCILVAAGGLDAVPSAPSSPHVSKTASPATASPPQEQSPTPPRRSSSSAAPAAVAASPPDAGGGWAAGAIVRRSSKDQRGAASPLLRAVAAPTTQSRHSSHETTTSGFVRATTTAAPAAGAARSLLGRHRGDSDADRRPPAPPVPVPSARPPLPTRAPAAAAAGDDDEEPPEPTTRAPTQAPPVPGKVSTAALLDGYD